MYILYLDESGQPDTREDYFVLGGIAAFERQTFFLSENVDAVQKTHFPAVSEPMEFHAYHIKNPNSIKNEQRRQFWKGVPWKQRARILQDIYSVIANAHEFGVVLFAAAIHKPSYQWDADKIHRMAFEEICRRFDLLVYRRGLEYKEEQRGLLILDRNKYEDRFRRLTAQYRSEGTQWGRVRNLADVPFFADSRATRLLQLADFCSYAVFRRYGAGDSSYLDLILGKFHQDEGRIHGLVHKIASWRDCYCPACMSRKSASQA